VSPIEIVLVAIAGAGLVMYARATGATPGAVTARGLGLLLMIAAILVWLALWTG